MDISKIVLNSGRASGGVVIFINDNIECEEINLNTHKL